MKETLISSTTLSAAIKSAGLNASSVQILGVKGGYSRNRRAIVGDGNKWVFVKEVDLNLLPSDGSEELWWLKKDHLCTEALRSIVPALVPEWSRLEAYDQALIMPGYLNDKGWLWEPPKDLNVENRYIQAVIDATKKFETVAFDEDTTERLKLEPYFRDKIGLDDGLELVIQNVMMRDQLKNKYTTLALNKSAILQRQYVQMEALLNDELELRVLYETAARLIEQPNDCFGHCDVRSDNIAFQPETSEIKFVDWNWASFVTKGFGATEFLIDMARRGVDVTPWLADLNIELLAALVGFYGKRCLLDPLAPGNTLRDMQAESAAVAYDLYRLAIIKYNE